MWNVQEMNEETELGWPTGLVPSLDFREVTLPSYAYSPQTVLANHPLDLTARGNEVYYFEAQVSSGLGSFIIGYESPAPPSSVMLISSNTASPQAYHPIRGASWVGILTHGDTKSLLVKSITMENLIFNPCGRDHTARMMSSLVPG
ncbi:hypothetical protein PHLCEN_2v13462 [Hermanssonia centrifuga]|uniref:Uncharacterized protein n=1 Tax=Hermanssonia centrifuga TaxID=98765 RepID=A0A2R6NE50_9APHY|nr:hypothetical protein PHLCEN_2v13462 [Hermanssonia centrifuga]